MIGTAKHIALLDFIRAYVEKNRVSPTQREMGDHMRTNCGNISRMLGALERNGLIWRTAKVARSVRMKNQGVCLHCQNEIGSDACRAAASLPITYSYTAKAA